jgi:hypothetical protein
MQLSDLEIRYAGVTCRACGCLFGVPTLGDFNYGEFILHGRGVAGFLQSIGEPAWDDIDARLRAQGLLPDKPAREQIDRMQEVIANAADRIGGQALSMRLVCPHCRSGDVEYSGAAGTFHRVPEVQFREYMDLGENARDELVARLWLDAGTRSGTIS